MYYKQKTGRVGEDLATEFLKNSGYEIVERNFACRQGEIDIIARDKCELVFVEVKTRSNVQYGNPAEAVTNIKQKHIEKSAEYYLYKNNLENEFVRIDVVEVYLHKNKYKINHIKQIK